MFLFIFCSKKIKLLNLKQNTAVPVLNSILLFVRMCMHSRFTGIITHTVHTAGTGALPVRSIFGGNVWSVLVEKLRYVAETGKIYTVWLDDYS